MARVTSPAEQLFAAWLRRLGSPDAPSFEEFVLEHPNSADELRALRARWDELEAVLRLAGLDPTNRGGFARRLRATHGVGADPEVSLDGSGPEPTKGTSGLLHRLERDASASRYRLEGEVARGGMGAVLRVWDEDIRRHLAMKVVLGDAPDSPETTPVDPRLLARFLEEAQVTGQLDHPGIVPVHELGLDQEGRVFFTMKLVKGRDLRAIYGLVFTGAEGWNETRALTVILKACEAVAYAHKKGVIHRDLKPANVMVGDFGEVYVMDWGLARVVGRADRHDVRIAPEGASSRSVRTERREEREETPDSPIITMDGDVVGTPAYMPPEQARGEVEKLNARSDVYALGAMLYHLLARQVPYVPAGARVSNRTVLGMVVQGPPTPLAEFRSDLPPELVAICEKAMSRDPERRYADTLGLAEDLRAYMEHRVVRAYRTGPIIELRKWVRRNRGTAAGLGAALLAVTGSIVVGAVLQSRAEHRELLLFDSRTAEGLVASFERLGPALPSAIDELRRWLSDADGLRSRRAEQQDLLALLERDPANASKANALRELLLRTGPAAERLQAAVEQRELVASSVEARTLTSPGARDRWMRAADAIAAEPQYRGLRLTPQLGLLPLGPDPQSKLWEFWHVLTGEEPIRDSSTGRWRITPDTGVVLVLLPGGPCAIGSLPIPRSPQARSWDEIFEFASRDKEWNTPWRDPGHRSSNEAFIESVELDPFFVSKYEMTQSQWTRLMLHNPSQRSKSEPDHPVETISWNEAVEAMRRSALELPTEVQWEYACRAGTTSPFSSGWEIESLIGKANVADLAKANSPESDGSETRLIDDHFVGHAPVGTFDPNPFGLFDMHGNVWEWCRDGYRDERVPRPGDGLDEGASGSAARAFRGGSFFAGPEAARSASRFSGGTRPTNADSDLGVRPCRSLTR